MATLMLPIEVTLIPNVQTIRDLGWLNSIQGLAVPFLATAFGIFLIRQGFLGIPRDLRDAAPLDGFGHLAFLRRVALPVTRPVVASFAVIAFLAAWNQYTWPRAVVTEGRWETIQIGLARWPRAPSTRETSAWPRRCSPRSPSSCCSSSCSAISSAASRPVP